MDHHHPPQNPNASLSPQRSLRPPPPPVPHLVPTLSPPFLARHHTIAGQLPPNPRPLPPPSPFRPHHTSLSSAQLGQNPPMTSVARPPSMYIPPGAILAVPADNPNAAPVPMIPYNPRSSQYVYYHQPQRTMSINRYASPLPPPRPPLPPNLKRLSVPPARSSSPQMAPSTSAPPRPPKPPELLANLSPSTQTTSSTAMSPSDLVSSASSHAPYTSSPAEGSIGCRDLQEKGRTVDELTSCDELDVIGHLTRGGTSRSPPLSRSRSEGQAVPRRSRTWEAPPPAYEESVCHEEFEQEEIHAGAAATGIDATFGRPGSPRANVQEVFSVAPPSGSSAISHPILAGPPPAETMEEVAVNQSDQEYFSARDNIGDISQGTDEFANEDVSARAPPILVSPRPRPARPTRAPPLVPSTTFEIASIQMLPMLPPTAPRFQLPPSRTPTPPSPVPSRPPSPVIFSPAALGYDPTTDTRMDPFADVPSTPPQTTFPIVRDASMSKRVPSDQSLLARGSPTPNPAPRRRRIFSSASVPGRERLSSLLLPRSSSTHSDKRPQSAVAGPTYHVDLLSSGGIILEHEWTEQGGLPYYHVPDGKKKRRSPTPPTELEVVDEISIAMGGGEMVDLWHGVEFGYRAPSWDVAPSLLRVKCPPSDFPSYDNPLTLYPSPSTPFFIRAPSWRALLRLLASLNETSIQPTPEALAEVKRGEANLRLVVQFVRTPFLPPVGKPKVEHREVALYLCVHREVPSTGSRLGKSLRVDDRNKWSSWDTSVLPYGFKAAAGSRLAKDNAPSTDTRLRSSSKTAVDAGTPVGEQSPSGDSSLFITLPPPFLELPAPLSDLALYLQDSLVLSRNGGKYRAMTDPKGLFEDPRKTRHILEKAHKSATNLTVPPPSRPLSMYSASSASRPSTSHSRMDSPSGTHLSQHHAPTFEGEVERGRGSMTLEQGGPPFTAPMATPQGSSPPSPVKPNPSPSPPPQINAAQIPGVKRLATAIKSFYPDEYTLGSSQAPTAEGSSKPQPKGIFGRIKSNSSGPLKPSRRPRDSNEERSVLVSPWRERVPGPPPGL